MNRIFISKLVRNLPLESYPHVCLHNQKLVFIPGEVGRTLGISSPAWPLRQSKIKKVGVEHETIPTISSDKMNNVSAAIGNHSSILYPSAFLLFLLRSNKPAAVSLIRWALREAIPAATSQSKRPEFIKGRFKLMELAGEHKGSFTRHVLIDLVGIKAKGGKNPLRFDDDGKPIEGGERCQKP